MRKSINTGETLQTWKEIKNFLCALDIKHKITLSTYTQKIESPLSECNLYLIKENHPIKIFSTAKKIEKAVLNSGAPIPTINEKDIRYFSFFDFKRSIFEKEIYCLDITSAYPTALFLLGYIDNNTFQELMKLPKKARLIAVGMLGSTKRIFNFSGKALESYEEIIKPTKGVFLHVCKFVGDILTETKFLLGNDFLFFWVDGIYFLKNEKTEKVLKEIVLLWQKKGFECKKEILNNFYFLIHPNKYEIEYQKNGKLKRFNLPLHPSENFYLE